MSSKKIKNTLFLMQLTRDQILAYDIATLHFRGIDFEDDDNEFDEYLSLT